MPRSAGLALYLASRSLAPRKKSARDASALARERPPGDVVWVHSGPGTDADAVLELARRITERRPGTSVVFTALESIPRAMAPAVLHVGEPEETARDIKRFLDHWRPGSVVLTGEVATPAAMVEIQSRGIPLVLVEARLPDGFARRLRWTPGAGAALLGSIAHILTASEADAETFRRLRAPAERIEARGHLEEGTAPLSCNRADHAALAALLAARPVWLAIAVEPGEVEAVVAAHRRAMRMAHRLLLILSPVRPEDGPALRDALEAEEWAVALRSDGEEPDPGIQIFVADMPGEAGLWYRLAPITFIGGSLVRGGEGRDPCEPAALGSAILTGPEISSHRRRVQRFLAAGAARTAGSAEALGEAVADLLAPDRTAEMARRAWEITSAGADLTDRVIGLVEQLLDGREPI
jgi:3-deoxy-D-manno-octulosonic-acid transferase